MWILCIHGDLILTTLTFIFLETWHLKMANMVDLWLVFFVSATWLSAAATVEDSNQKRTTTTTTTADNLLQRATKFREAIQQIIATEIWEAFSSCVRRHNSEEQCVVRTPNAQKKKHKYAELDQKSCDYIIESRSCVHLLCSIWYIWVIVGLAQCRTKITYLFWMYKIASPIESLNNKFDSDLECVRSFQFRTDCRNVGETSFHFFVPWTELKSKLCSFE